MYPAFSPPRWFPKFRGRFNQTLWGNGTGAPASSLSNKVLTISLSDAIYCLLVKDKQSPCMGGDARVEPLDRGQLGLGYGLVSTTVTLPYLLPPLSSHI